MSIHTHLEQLRIVNEGVSSLNTRIRNLADMFNGSEPEDPRTVKPAGPSGHTINNQFGEVISNIQDTIVSIAHQTERLEMQLFDNAPGSIGRSAVERAY